MCMCCVCECVRDREKETRHERERGGGRETLREPTTERTDAPYGGRHQPKLEVRLLELACRHPSPLVRGASEGGRERHTTRERGEAANERKSD